MSKYIVKEIVEYITHNIGLNKEEVEKRANKELKQIISSYFRGSIHTTKDENLYFLELIDKLKEIREIYQKGKPFIENQFQKPKGSTKRIIRILKYQLERNEHDKAKKEAKKHLEYIKKWKSERTYYRHLKQIRELGIEI